MNEKRQYYDDLLQEYNANVWRDESHNLTDQQTLDMYVYIQVQLDTAADILGTGKDNLGDGYFIFDGKKQVKTNEADSDYMNAVIETAKHLTNINKILANEDVKRLKTKHTEFVLCKMLINARNRYDQMEISLTVDGTNGFDKMLSDAIYHDFGFRVMFGSFGKF